MEAKQAASHFDADAYRQLGNRNRYVRRLVGKVNFDALCRCHNL